MPTVCRVKHFTKKKFLAGKKQSPLPPRPRGAAASPSKPARKCWSGQLKNGHVWNLHTSFPTTELVTDTSDAHDWETQGAWRQCGELQTWPWSRGSMTAEAWDQMSGADWRNPLPPRRHAACSLEGLSIALHPFRAGLTEEPAPSSVPATLASKVHLALHSPRGYLRWFSRNCPVLGFASCKRTFP